MTRIQDAATAASRRLKKLAAAAEAAAARQSEWRACQRKQAYRAAIHTTRERNRRISLAAAGVAALRALGSSPQVQSYLEVGGSIVLWHLVDECRISESYICMGRSSLLLVDQGRELVYGSNDSVVGTGNIIQDERLVMEIPYESEDPFLMRLGLRKLHTTLQHLDADDEARRWHRQPGMAPRTTEMQFQVLMDCADPKKLEGYFLRAIGAARLAA